jgi:hypothetical protein
MQNPCHGKSVRSRKQIESRLSLRADTADKCREGRIQLGPFRTNEAVIHSSE